MMVLLVSSAATAPDSARPIEKDACRSADHAGTTITVCTFDLRSADMRLFLNDDSGRPYGSFGALRRSLRERGFALPFAMNAGMYHPDRSPVGLYVEGGNTLKQAVTGPGPGNFHMRPNGVFYISGDEAGVLETRQFGERRVMADYATQSGPMLVIGGALHPRFIPGSEFRKVRNGVGVRDRHTVVFAISDGAINFHDLATFFRDRLGCDNALYLDGTISSLYAPEFGRSDFLFPLGPIVAVVEKGEPE